MHRDSNASIKSRNLFMGKMKNREAFQTQLASILETLAKAAVTEITKLVEERSVVLRLEVSKSHKEIDCLRRKLQLTESRLRTTQEAATRQSRSVGVQSENLIEAATRENCFIRDQDEDPFEGGGAVKCGTDAPFAEQLNQTNCKAQTRDTRPDFGFAPKEEQEGEHVAHILHRTESEHCAGRLNNVRSEYLLFEIDCPQWSSFTQVDSDVTDDPACANVTEPCSQSQPVLSPIQHTPASSEVSGSTLSSVEKDDHVVYGGVVKEEVGGECLYAEESRSVMDDTQQTGHEQPPLLTTDRLTSQVFHPVRQQFELQTGVSENSRAPVSTRRPVTGEKLYSCAQCQRRFDRFPDLERHQRIHTGEKPFNCAQCGKRFRFRCNLVTHEKIHTGNKPFACVHCGKRFTRGTSLRVHKRIHTGERPYHCTQCGNSFTQLGNLKTHQKIHRRK